MTVRGMAAKVAGWLRTPVGYAAAWTAGTGLVCVLLGFGLDVPGRWVDGWPRLLQAVAYVGAGVAVGMSATWLRTEVERWQRLRDEYDAAQRDIERMERGER